MATQKRPKIPLPKSWPLHLKSAVVHVISLAHFSITHARGWASNSGSEKVRTASESDRLYEEIALLREELRIKDARMCAIAALRRPRYAPAERLAILEVRTARGWTLKQTANAFLVSSPTVASWFKRVDEEGLKALLQLREPVNRFPDFVRYAVQRLKTLCPRMGKVKIAQTLARAGLHLKHDYRGTDVEGTVSSRGKATGGGVNQSRGYREGPQPCMAPRLDGRTDGLRLLGFLAALCPAPMLAFLLVGGPGHRPLLATLASRDGASQKARLAGCLQVAGSCHSVRQVETEPSGLRQGQSLLVQYVQGVVSRQRNQAALRCHWQAGQHSCRGTRNKDYQG